jgi:putative SOS response-associated peptidase YedK
MCGRFVLRASPDQLAELFDLQEEPMVAPRYNIAPSQPVAIVRVNPQTQQREWTHTLWGLIPSWSKDPTIGQKMINARSDGVAEKPSFRAAFKRRRCLIPASGFYEWKQTGDGKEPHFITSAAGEPLAFAGLWEQWTGGDGVELQTCTILTTDANELVTPLHNRMPVIIAPEDYSLWLGSGRDETPAYLSQLQHLLRPYSSELMKEYAVSKYVNNVRNEGEKCIEPVTGR